MSKLIQRENSPNWWFDFTIQGRRVRGSTYTANKKLAEEYAAKVKSKAYSELKLGRKQDITLEQALSRYWTEHAQGQAWSRSVWGYMRRFSQIWGANTYLSEIDNNKYSLLVSHLKKVKLKTGKKDEKGNPIYKYMSPTTINRHTECFRKVYRLAKDTWGLEVGKIDFTAHRLKQPDSRIRYLTLEESKLLIECAAPHLQPIIQFALYTGARLKNILNLQWRDVDMVGRQLIFKVKSTMPGGKNHIIPMADECYKMLKALKRNAVSEYVFTYKGNPISDNVKKAFRTACRKAKITDFRFHDLRHTCASWLVQNDTPIEVVKDILGHTDIKTTLKYAHHDVGRKLEALNNVFGGKR